MRKILIAMNVALTLILSILLCTCIVLGNKAQQEVQSSKPGIGEEENQEEQCKDEQGAQIPSSDNTQQETITEGDFPKVEETTQATTEELSTQAPTTNPPLTEPPTTEPPTTEPPETESPTTEPPVTESGNRLPVDEF